jgi:hypothetical protein
MCISGITHKEKKYIEIIYDTKDTHKDTVLFYQFRNRNVV